MATAHHSAVHAPRRALAWMGWIIQSCQACRAGRGSGSACRSSGGMRQVSARCPPRPPGGGRWRVRPAKGHGLLPLAPSRLGRVVSHDAGHLHVRKRHPASPAGCTYLYPCGFLRLPGRALGRASQRCLRADPAAIFGELASTAYRVVAHRRAGACLSTLEMKILYISMLLPGV